MSAHHRRDEHASLGVGGPTDVRTISRRDELGLREVVLAEQPERDRLTVVHLDPHEPSRYERWVKPAIDVTGAMLLLVVLAPVMLLVAVGVRRSLGRGVLYRQVRIGQDGTPFTMFKFRSMIADRRLRDEPPASFDGRDRRRTHKHPSDPRVTPFGDFIRRYSLDELPQLFNVLRGELSLVGPRPELAEIVAGYEPWQHRRHEVKPGLTGLWQVTERDREGRMHLCVQTDLEYIDRVSLVEDLRILVQTVPAVLGAEPGRPLDERI